MRFAGGVNPSGGHQQQGIGDAGGVVEVVQHDADGDSVSREVAHQVQGLDLVSQVQVVGGFVQEDDAGVLGQAGSQPHTLDLTAGEFADGTVPPCRRTPVATIARLIAAWSSADEPGEAAPVGMPAERHDLAHGESLRRGAGLGEESYFAGELPGAEQ